VAGGGGDGADRDAAEVPAQPFNVDLDALDAANNADYAERANVNKDAKREEQLGIHAEFALLPKSEVDESAIVDKLQRAGEHNAEIETRKAGRENAEREAELAASNAERIRQEIEKELKRASERAAELRAEADRIERDAKTSADNAEKEADTQELKAKELRTKLANAKPLSEPIDPATIREELAAAQVANRKFKERREVEAHRKESARLKAESKAITERMERRTKQKMDAIAKANIPVAGLGFGEGYLTYNGKPLDQASDMEQIQVSAEIGMSENPELRVMRIRHGDQFDDDAMKVLAQIAKERDFQIWIERVTPSSDAAIIMEDGMVQANG